MKTQTILATLAAVVGLSLHASAQCPAGMALGDPGAEPVSISLKFAWKNAEVKPVALKNALEKLPTVVRTGFDEKNPNLILVKFKGRCDQIASLEAAASSAGVPAYVVNHAHVSVVLKTQPGANVKGAVEALGKVGGALFAKVSGNNLEIHSDLNALNIDEIRNAVAPFKCDAVVNQSFEFVRFKVLEGDVQGFVVAANAIKGVMTVRGQDENVIGMWINKAVVKAEAIEKTEGFKLKRQ